MRVQGRGAPPPGRGPHSPLQARQKCHFLWVTLPAGLLSEGLTPFSAGGHLRVHREPSLMVPTTAPGSTLRTQPSLIHPNVLSAQHHAWGGGALCQVRPRFTDELAEARCGVLADA